MSLGSIMSNINKQNIDALLSETRRDREWSQRIVEFSQELVNQDKSLWHEYWIPKLALQRNDLPEPFLKLKSVESLNRAISLVPYAFFDYDLSHQWIDDSDILDSFPPTHPERICILNLSYNNLTAIGLDNIFRSAKFNKISAIYVDFNPIRSAGFEAICHTFLDIMDK